VTQAVMIYGIFSVVASLVAAMLARIKNRSADKWAFSSFLFPPAVLLLLLLGKNNKPLSKNILSEKEKREIKEYMFD
jgi:hypothetical protein